MKWRIPLWGYERTIELFDLNTEKYVLAGHSQFGFMGHLLMDSKAEISAEVQHELMLKHIIPFLREL